jgi:hypothetical protein
MYFIKVIIFGLMPIFGLIIAAIIWYIIYLFKYYREGAHIRYKKNLRVTFYTILYLMYPSISNLSFSLFNCFSLDDGNSYLRRDFLLGHWVSSLYIEEVTVRKKKFRLRKDNYEIRTFFCRVE